jgi:GTP-binding protein
LLLLTKIETVDEKRVKAAAKQLEKASGQTVYPISAQAHQGLERVLYAALEFVQEARIKRAEAQAEAYEVVINEAKFPDMWKITEEEDGAFRITGERIEGFARRTDFQSDDGTERLRDIMRKMGIGKQLDKRGVEPGTLVRIGELELEWL